MESDYKYLFKLILIGDSGVGKTSVLSRYLDEDIQENHISTIGVDFKIKTIVHNGETVKLLLWDTAGQEKFSAITKSYYRGSHGIIIIFDVTHKDSFTSIDKWMKKVKENASEDVEFIIIGNKCDLTDEIVIKRENVYEFLDSNKIDRSKYYETSAKENICIADAFNKLTSILVDNFGKKGEVGLKDKIFPSDIARKKGGCC